MKTQKILSYIMAMIIAVSLFAGTAVTASAFHAYFTFEDTTAYAGEQAVVDVYLNAKDLFGFHFEVDYNTTLLTLKDVVMTEEFEKTFSFNGRYYDFNKNYSAILFTLTNKTPPPAPFQGVALRMIFDVKELPAGQTQATASVAVSSGFTTLPGNPYVTYLIDGTPYFPPKFPNTSPATVTILKRFSLDGMSLNGDSFSLKPGASKDLGALVTYTPSNASDKTIDWSSSKPEVATVDSNGKVTAVSPGTTIITGVSRDNPDLKITATITVPTLVTDVSLPETVSVAVKATKKLTPTITPSNATDKSVTWKSDNNLIATVSQSGVVTGVKAGKTTITVTTNDGKMAAQCAVTVTSAASSDVPATGLTVPTATVNGAVGKTTKTSYAVKPSNSTDKPIFSSSNTKVATVDSKGNIKGVKAGTVTITVKVGKITKKFKVTIHNYVTLKIGSTKAIHNGANTTVDKEGTKPFLVDGRTMIPLRFVGEKMGGKVKYVSDSKPIILTYEGVTVSITLNSKTMTVTAADGKTSKVTLDVAAQKRNGRTFIPLRAVSQALGFTVYYQSTTTYIVVNNPKMGAALRDVRLTEAKGYLK